MIKNNNTDKDFNRDNVSSSNSHEKSDSSNRGFASMDPERRREVARKGGLAAHKSSRYEDDDYGDDNKRR
jgi:general stress protein YciG